MLLNKVEGVEEATSEEISEPRSADGRDLTKYEFQGEIYSKAKLVHAVVKQYVMDNPLTTFDELEMLFPPELQAYSFPVFMEWDEAYERFSDKTPKRFYLDEKMRIELVEGGIAVCTQWGVENIHNFINKAKSLNYEITPTGYQSPTDGNSSLERQCRICGEWKSIAENYSYPPVKRQHYWCLDCYKEYNAMKANSEDPIPWIRSMQSKWDYQLRKVNPDRLRSGTGKTTQKGYINRNNQKNLGTCGHSGTDHNALVYNLECLDCGHAYGANGTDVFQRKCPECQNGKPGIKI
jgi:hypothetical protein